MLFLGFPPVAGWLGFGLALMAIEMLAAPGSYLLWVGLAALAMAGLSALLVLGPGVELFLFGGLALASALVGVKVYGGRERNGTSRDLDDPAAGLVGRELQLASAIENGTGHARFGDSTWRVVGPDLPAGTIVVVRAIDGASLVVAQKQD